MNETPEQVARWSSRWIALSWIVLLAGVLISALAWVAATVSVQRQADEAFDRESGHLSRALQQAVDHHIDLLLSFQSAFSATGQLDRTTFHQLYASRDVARRYPAFVAIQFAQQVSAADRAAFEQRMRAEGQAGFRIHPAGDRPAYLPVVFVEPAGDNAAVLGYDQAFESTRQAVMAHSRDSGLPQASGPVRLVSGRDQAPGVVVRLPVYRPGLPLRTPEERRRAYLGQIGGAIRADDLARGVLPASRWQQWHWRIDDTGRSPAAGGRPEAPTPVFDTTRADPAVFVPPPTTGDEDRRHARVDVAGRQWALTLTRPGTSAGLSPFPLTVLAGGLLGTLGLWWALRNVGTQHGAAAAMARALSRQALANERRLHKVMDSTIDGIITVDALGGVLTANLAAQKIFGCLQEGRHPATVGPSASHCHIGRLIPPAPGCPFNADMARFLAGHLLEPAGLCRRLEGRRHDGSRFPLEVTANPMELDGQPLFVLVVRDVTEQLQAEQAVMAAQRQLDEVDEMRRVIVHHAPYAILVLNRQGIIQTINPAGEALLGYTAQDLIGQSTAQRFFDPEQVGERARMLALRLNKPVKDLQVLSYLAQKSPGLPTEWTLVRSNGHRIVAEVSVTMLHDDAGTMTGYLAMAQDVTLRTEAEQQLQHQAQHDALTGLPNRNMLQEQLKTAVAQAERHQHHVALMFLDLDRFKKINDTLGHHIGDNVIIEVGRRLSAGMRGTDLVARLGGDEFGVLLPHIAQVDDGVTVAHKVLELFNEPLHVGPHELRITPSIGVAVFPVHGVDAATLVRQADLAMYQAKNQGRNRVQVYTSDMEAVSADKLMLENDLYRALERDELRLHFQPQFDCATGRISGAEALLRWEHGGRLVPPMDFIPFAEETGLIVPMGEWVLRQACAKAQAWRSATGLPLRIAVNLSATQLESTGIAATVGRALADTGLPPTALELEITETVVVRESLRAADVLAELRALGVSIAIDDFGVGYSSFGYLRELPVDRFKLDRSFLSAIPQSAGDCRLAAALIAMAHRLDVGIVAEGVETQEQFTFLRDHGCDEAQGYHLGRPMNESAFEALLHGHAAASRSQAVVD